MKKIIVIVVLAFIGFLGKAQVDTATIETSDFNIDKSKGSGDIRVLFMRNLSKTLNRDLYFKTPKDSAYLISIAASFNAKGEIDTVLFPKKVSDYTRTVLGLNNKLVEIYKNLDLRRFNYRNQVIMFPLLFVQHDDKNIKLNEGFFNDYKNLWPEFGSILKDKQLVLLDPYIVFYGMISQH